VRVIAAGGDFASRQVTVDSSSPGVGLRSLAPSPLHVAGGDTLRAVYNIREGATLVARIEHVNPTRIVKTYARRTQAAPGLAEFTWNGKNVAGHDARPGRYALVLQVTDRAGNVTVQRDRFRVVR
jgi:flagellar hook assembly protein FlgD